MDAINKAIAIVGSQAGLASHLDVTKSAVNQCANGVRPIPAEWCPKIERATKGEVRCEELRPDVDWAVLRKTA